MSLRITLGSTSMTVQTEPDSDRKSTRFKNESALWYALKNELIRLHGMDLVKRVMSKDGHLVGGHTYPYYLRDRKGAFCIHDPSYALRDLAQDLKEDGLVHLEVVNLGGFRQSRSEVAAC